MEPLGVLIGAALGSAGVSGVLAGLVQFSRAARSSRSIDQLTKGLAGGLDGPGRDALLLALNRERLRLASFSLITLPRAAGVLVASTFLVLGAVVAGVVYASVARGGETTTLVPFFAVSLLYGILLTFIFDTQVQLRRRRFIDEAERQADDVSAIAGRLRRG